MRFGTRASRCVWLSLSVAAGVWVAAAAPTLRSEGRAAQSGAFRPKPTQNAAAGRPIRVLFLGQEQNPLHSTASMFPLLASPLARRGIQLTPVLTPQEALVPARLAHYDALMIYGNHTTVTPDQEKALLDFVEGGKGLIAIHSASEMFPASDKYTSLIGAQSQRRPAG